jgi:hypothetical protein
MAIFTNLADDIHELEEQAILLDRKAIVNLVSIGRSLRAYIEILAASRFTDGEVSAVALTNFLDTVEQEYGDAIARIKEG